MDPYLEQRLRDEVIYLHSLWHQGPPTNPNPRIPNPTKRKRIRSPNDQSPNKKQSSQPDPPPHSDPTPPQDSAPGPSSHWPSMPKKPNLSPVASPEEQARLAALKLQHKALDTCRELFWGNAGSDSDSEEEYQSDKDGDDYWVENGENEEYYKLLLNVFVEQSELRSYYEVNYESGEFYCLVCGGLGKKKKIKGCVGLVQHSIAISNTKKKRAHRAFAQVVCKVLGWDFDRLPTIVRKGERLGLSLAKPDQEQGEPEVNAGSCEGVSDAFKDNVTAENDANAESGEKEAFDEHQNNGKEIMTCQNSLDDDCTNKNTESLDKGISETEANKETVDAWGSVKSLVSTTEWPCKESSVSSSTVLGWPTFISQSDSATCSNPVEEQARSAAVLLQQKALKACQDFFILKAGTYSDEDDSDEDGSEESEELKFFSKIFTEDGKLRSFYENNFEDGEFCCLVCGGVGKKVWKRFKGCIALLQHSTTIIKTKKKVAHRAYGQVICKVLGWDIGRLPTIVSNDRSVGEPLEKSDNLQGEVEENAGDHKDTLVVSKENLDSMSGYNSEIVSKEESDVAQTQSDGTSSTCELQGEAEKKADGQNEDLNAFLENLDPL